MPAEALRGDPGGVRAREDIDHEVTRLGQELDEKRGQLLREPGGMAIEAVLFAHPKVEGVAVRVGDRQQVWRDGPAVVRPEPPADVVAGRSLAGLVEAVRVCDELLHPLGVRGQNLAHIGLRLRRLAEPPHRVHRVLCPDLPLVDPFDRGGQLRRVEPVEVLCEKEPHLVAERDEHSEVVERARRHAGLVRPTQVQHEAAGVLQDAANVPRKWHQPLDVLGLGYVSVGLLPAKRERWGGHHQVHRAVWQPGKQGAGIADVGRAQLCSIQRAPVGQQPRVSPSSL